jgi:hypothetical protein
MGLGDKMKTRSGQELKMWLESGNMVSAQPSHISDSKGKLWLDDERPAPDGWVLAKTAIEALAKLRQQEFEVVSLDHDLGEESGSGYDVLLYIEAQVFTNPNFKCPELRIHSANPAGCQMMQLAIEINRKLDKS